MARQCVCPVLVAICAVGAALLWPAALRVWRLSQTLIAPDDKDSDALRIGILGASFIARAAIVSAADKRRDVVVSAVAARDVQRAKEYASRFSIPVFHGGATAYSDLLKRDDVDAVYVGLPTPFHLEWSLAALRAGRDVLLEKPAVMNAREASELSQEAIRTGRIVFEAAHYRYHPAAQRAKQRMFGNGHGGISPVHALEVRFSMLDPKAWLQSFWSGEVTLAQRVKNFDRWWYSVDMLLWCTDAVEVEVISAAEKPFSLSATLRLHTVSQVINASMSMARDSAMDPFTWRLSASGPDGQAPLHANAFIAFFELDFCHRHAGLADIPQFRLPVPVAPA